MSSVTILYHPKSEQDRPVRELVFNYKRQTGKDLETISLETVEGADMAKLYGIVDYPALVARDNQGKLLKLWQGKALPLINEISFYDQD